MRVTGLRVNHIAYPLGFSLDNPSFSWTVEESAGTKAVSSRLYACSLGFYVASINGERVPGQRDHSKKSPAPLRI